MRIWNGTEQLLYDANRERELMDILGIQSMGEVTIIPWRSPRHAAPGCPVCAAQILRSRHGGDGLRLFLL